MILKKTFFHFDSQPSAGACPAACRRAAASADVPTSSYGFSIDGTESTNSKNMKWKFSWDSIVNGNEVKAEVNAGSLGSSEGLWLAVDLSVSRSNFRTRVSFLAPDSEELKVRFKVSNTAGQSNNWRYATVSS